MRFHFCGNNGRPRPNYFPLSHLRNKLQMQKWYQLISYDDGAWKLTLHHCNLTTPDENANTSMLATSPYDRAWQHTYRFTKATTPKAKAKPPKNIQTAIDASVTILMNDRDELPCYWHTYDIPWLPLQPQGRAWDRLTTWQWLQLIFGNAPRYTTRKSMT